MLFEEGEALLEPEALGLQRERVLPLRLDCSGCLYSPLAGAVDALLWHKVLTESWLKNTVPPNNWADYYHPYLSCLQLTRFLEYFGHWQFSSAALFLFLYKPLVLIGEILTFLLVLGHIRPTPLPLSCWVESLLFMYTAFVAYRWGGDFAAAFTA